MITPYSTFCVFTKKKGRKPKIHKRVGKTLFENFMKTFKNYPKPSLGSLMLILNFLLGSLFFLPAYGQNNKPSVNSPKGTSIKNLKVSVIGRYYGGVPNTMGIDVSYNDIFKNKEVLVQYSIMTKYDDSFKTSEENNDLWYKFISDSISGLVAGGNIICKTEDKIDTLAVFTDVVYFTHPKLFGGWLVANKTPYGLSNSTLLSGQNIHSSSFQSNNKENIKFQNQKVTFLK
jgi:hypothetical protein